MQIEEKYLKIVLDILSEHPYEYYVFGSRARNTAKKFSDLDICIKGSITKSEYRNIKNQFEESNLPFKVDMVVWDQITPEFQKNIQTDFVLLKK